MDDLISRLETADFDVPIPRGGATPRALDYAIHVAIGWMDHDQGGWWRGDAHMGLDWPHYTTSLDAALTLVPKGWWWRADSDGDVELYDHDWANPACRIETGSHRNLSIAFCIAALKARQTC
jgi:hypothetical protein